MSSPPENDRDRSPRQPTAAIPHLGEGAARPLGTEGSDAPVRTWVRRTFAAFEVRNYRLFYYGQALSLTGTWMRRTALGWLVYKVTGSMTMLGAVMALTLLPLFILSPLAGSLADRMDKRRLIVASQVLAFFASGTLAFLIFLDVVTLWHIFVLGTLGGVAFAIEVPARQAFVVEMVGRRHLLNAIALNSALVNAARIVGPAIAGIIMGLVGMSAVFALDAVSYLIVIASLLALRLEKTRLPLQARSHLQLMREGVREVLHNEPVRMVLALLLLTGVFGWSFQALMPAIAQDVLLLDETRYGILMSMFGIGAISAALFTASRSENVQRIRYLFLGVVVMNVGVLAMSLARTYPAMCLCLAVAGFGGILFVSMGNTVVQLNVADSIRGRVMGIWALAFGGSLPLGNLLAGVVADLFRGMGMTASGGLYGAFANAFLGSRAAFLTIGLSGIVMATGIWAIYIALGARRLQLTGAVDENDEQLVEAS